MAGLEGLALLWSGAGLSRFSPAVYPVLEDTQLGTDVTFILTLSFDLFFHLGWVALLHAPRFLLASPLAKLWKWVTRGLYSCITGPRWGKPFLVPWAMSCASNQEDIAV